MEASAAPKGPIAEAYRTLRTNLQFIAKDEGFKVAAVTSATAGEGKTTTASNLAFTLAQTGQRVVAVSCDLRKPRLHSFYGLSNYRGLSDILQGTSTVAEASQSLAGTPSLRVIASGSVPANPAELLGSKEMLGFLDNLRKVADFVILDCPPVLAVSDALILSPLSDGVIMVADAQSTSRGAATHAAEQLIQVGANLIGSVLNNFDRSQAAYYPYQNAYYYGSYDYHYHEPDPAEERSHGSRDPGKSQASGLPPEGFPSEESWR